MGYQAPVCCLRSKLKHVKPGSALYPQVMAKRLILIIFFALLMLGAVFFAASFFFSSKSVVVNPLLSRASLANDFSEKENTITLFFVGDIMLDRGVEYQIKKEGKGNWKFPFLKIAGDLEKADIIFGNLESPISDKGQKIGSKYSFRADPGAVEGLKYAGFDILSLANNHALDYGREALEQTMGILKEQGIKYVGAGLNQEEAFGPRIFRIKDTKIAFLAFTNLGSSSWAAAKKRPGIAWIDDIKKAEEAVAKAKTEADIIIVSLHSGQEYSLEPTSFQISFAKSCIAAGADLVVGHHPHVVQPVVTLTTRTGLVDNDSARSRVRQGWVVYSLGNFIFDQSFSKDTMKGLLLEVQVKDKEIKKVLPREIKINKFFQPEFKN